LEKRKISILAGIKPTFPDPLEHNLIIKMIFSEKAKS
jgi:hypothetical protein